MKKPNLALLFLFAALAFAACNKSTIIFTPSSGNLPGSPQGGGNTAGTQYEYYFKGTLNGLALSWQVISDGPSNYSAGSAYQFTQSPDSTIGAIGATISLSTTFPIFLPRIEAEFRTIAFDHDDDQSVYFKSFLKPGAITYATDDILTPGTKAIVIKYTDKDGKVYSSIGPQTGNTANVLAVTYMPPELGTREYQKIKLTFACKLYPTDGIGSSMTLTGAEATMKFINEL